MPREYEVTNTSGFTAEIKDIVLGPNDNGQDCEEFVGVVETGIKDIVLDPDNNVEKGNTRRVVKAKIVDNADKSERRVNITLAHQRRHKKKEGWEDIDSFTLAHLKGGEEAKIHLGAKETYELFMALQDLYAISTTGVPNGKKGFYVVYRNQSGGSVPGETIGEFIEFLHDGGADIWEAVTKAKLKIPSALAYHRILEVRQEAIAQFECHLTMEDWNEGDWQKFFSENEWIFGHGLAYQFLETITDQPYYGGKNFMGKDGQRGDYLLATQADARFTVLVEIKRPDALLLTPEKYRNKVYRLSEDLAGGVSQMQSNCRTWTQDGARQEDNKELLEGISTYQPKGILVIGNTTELKGNSQKQASFELFRRNLQNPEILTFDELLARARFLVANQPAAGDTNYESH